MGMQLVCTSKNIWAELSYGFGPSCLINLGRVGKGRVLCGPSWHGPSWFWAELSVIQNYFLGKLKLPMPNPPTQWFFAKFTLLLANRGGGGAYNRHCLLFKGSPIELVEHSLTCNRNYWSSSVRPFFELFKLEFFFLLV